MGYSWKAILENKILLKLLFPYVLEMLFLFHVALEKLSSLSKQEVSSELNAGIKFICSQNSQQETTLS